MYLILLKYSRNISVQSISQDSLYGAVTDPLVIRGINSGSRVNPKHGMMSV